MNPFICLNRPFQKKITSGGHQHQGEGTCNNAIYSVKQVVLQASAGVRRSHLSMYMTEKTE